LEKLNIIIVDDNHAFRKGLRFFLEQECNCNVIAEARNGNEFLALENLHAADIILMDIAMPEKGGYQTTIEATFLNVNLRIIAVTAFEELAYVRLIIESGFKGCIFKDNIFDVIETALDDVMKNKYYIPEGIKL